VDVAGVGKEHQQNWPDKANLPAGTMIVDGFNDSFYAIF